MLDNSSKDPEVMSETMLHAIKLIVQQKVYKGAVHFHTVTYQINRPVFILSVQNRIFLFVLPLPLS